MKYWLILLISISSFNFAQFKNDIAVINKSDLDQIIKTRNSKLLLINIWAAWCIPCREEFPDLVKLESTYSDNLDIIAISVDFKEDIESQVKPFLIENKVQFPVYLSGFRTDEQFIEYFNKKWNGALPASFIYNSEGIQIKFLEGKHSFENFSSEINTLL